jgi:multidrug efflux system outer membrane protein
MNNFLRSFLNVPRWSADQRRTQLRWLMAGAPGALVMTLLLTGCDLFNPYEQPATAKPEAFVEKPDVALVKPGWPDDKWWTGFNSDELNALEEQAEKNNFDLGAAAARVREADAQVRITGSALLPSLEADAGATHTHAGKGKGGTATTTTTGSRSGTIYTANLQAAYEIDFWGKNRSALTAAEATRDAQAFDSKVVAISINGSVATVYFDLLATRERIAVAQDNIANANKTLDALNRQFKAGIISRLDVAQQQTVVAQQTAAIAPLQLELSQDRDALALLVGQLPEKLDVPQKMKLGDIALPRVPAGVPSELLTRRPDVAEAESGLIAAHANINVARAQFFPSIGLTGSAGYQSTALNSLFNSGGFATSFGANLVQPIFEGGLLTGQLELAHAQEEELAQDYYKAVVNAFSDTEDALAGLQRLNEQEKAQADVVRTAKDAYMLSQRQFEGGIVDITSVLNTQRALFSAQDGYLLARQQQLAAIVALYQALGGGVKMPHTEADKII